MNLIDRLKERFWRRQKEQQPEVYLLPGGGKVTVHRSATKAPFSRDERRRRNKVASHSRARNR